MLDLKTVFNSSFDLDLLCILFFIVVEFVFLCSFTIKGDVWKGIVA